MRYMVMNEAHQNTETGQIESRQVKLELLPTTSPLPANHKAYFLPRIRCLDCPGRLYNAGPEHTVSNFELHLKNRGHMKNVADRTGKGV